jgi:hypothetical protein
VSAAAVERRPLVALVCRVPILCEALTGALEEVVEVILAQLEDQQKPPVEYVGEPGEKLVGPPGGQLGPVLQLFPQRIEGGRVLPANREQMTLGQEAVKRIRADLVVAELVEHDEKVVAEVVDLGQVRVLHRVPHSERVET